MANNGNIDEFNALVTNREGHDRKKQEDYLIGVLKTLVVNRSKGSVQPSDDISVLKMLGVEDADNVFAAIKTAGGEPIYSAIAKLLLDDSNNKWDIVLW